MTVERVTKIKFMMVIVRFKHTEYKGPLTNKIFTEKDIVQE